MSLTSLNHNRPVLCRRGRFAEARQVRNDEILTETWRALSRKNHPNIPRFSIPKKMLFCSRSYLGPEKESPFESVANQPLSQPFVLYNQLSLFVAIHDLSCKFFSWKKIKLMTTKTTLKYAHGLMDIKNTCRLKLRD